MKTPIAICSLALFAWASSASAETPTVADDAIANKKEIQERTKKEIKHGWTPQAAIGAAFGVGTSSSVVGQTDGTTVTIGAQLSGGVTYRDDVHEWRNGLKINEVFTRSPALHAFAKTSDIFAIDSIYLYHFRSAPWIGPYARLQFDTALFQGFDKRAVETTYAIKRLSGATDDRVGKTLRLSDPFQPARLQESLGVFAQYTPLKNTRFEFRAGFGARQTFAKGALAINDNSTTAAVEVLELDDVHQGGPAFGIEAESLHYEGKIRLYGLFEAMMPVISSVDDPEGRSAAELTNLLFEAGLSFKMVSWASLNYALRALKEPQVFDQFQVQNTLLLNFGWNILGG